MSEHIERIAKAIAFADMLFTLGDSGVMALSPERAQALFENTWAGTEAHDELCRSKYRMMAQAAYKECCQ